MKVLHLFSNSKWTGPAEPALNLCLALRAAGIDTDFACTPDAGRSVNKVVETARDRGLEPILKFHLEKHRHLVYNFFDRRALAAFLSANHYDLIHCHLDNDHAIALDPARRHAIPVVRSNYFGTGFPDDRRHAALLHRTAWLIEPSRLALDHDAAAFGFPCDRINVVPGAVDVARFDPARDTPDGRSWLRIPHDAFVAGIVARIQMHRHYIDLLEAFRQLLEVAPNSYLIIIGRGSKQEQVARQPVRELGLEDHVRFTGFIDGENYVGMLKAFDVGVFLVPGSDGTCRAVREIMAMAKPMIVADRGMLREIVTHGTDGIVCDGSADGLYQNLRRLSENRSERQQLGRTARDTAVNRYSLEAQSRAIAAVYERVLRTP